MTYSVQTRPHVEALGDEGGRVDLSFYRMTSHDKLWEAVNAAVYQLLALSSNGYSISPDKENDYWWVGETNQGSITEVFIVDEGVK